MRDEPEAGLRCLLRANLDPTKGVGRLRKQDGGSWKSKSAKECVTTHLPNQLARKWMALKRATYTRPSGQVPGPMSRRARRSLQNLGREPGGAAVGADLGGSSKYSNENFEGRRGERESGDVGGGLGKSYLFCLTACPPWKRLSGGRVQRLEEHAPHVAWCPVRPRRPLKIRRTECRSRPVVLITASGLQGEQPSGRWNNVGKGSRQNGSVTSGKGLALRGLGTGVPVPNPSAVGGLLELLPRRERVAACRPGDGTGNGPFGVPSPGVEQSTQNWYGQGESDCLIKNKALRWSLRMLTQCDSAQCSECQSEEIQPSAGKRRE
ncbi:hypothetical protein L6164_037912 [Bauhinia variegata]|nr:hypothetical protein L6164_037912 [Bauhinia variegata]